MSDGLRFYATGTCDGYGELVAALGGTQGSSSSDTVPRCATRRALCPAATSTPSSMRPAAPVFPARRVRGDPRAHPGARDPPRLGRLLRPPRGRARGRRGRRHAAPPADGERRLRDPQGQPCRPRAGASTSRRAVATVFSPEGRHRQDRGLDEPRGALRQHHGSARCSRPRPPVRRRGDHARDRARQDDLRPRRRPGRARHREARRLHDAARVAASTSCRRRSARRTPSSSPRRKLARLLEVARASYDAIVVDTSPFFHGPMLATLDRTDELLLLCGLDVPTIKNVRLACRRSSCSRSRPSASASSSTARTRTSGSSAARSRRRSGRRCASSCRATAPCRWRSTAATRSCSPIRARTSRRRSASSRRTLRAAARRRAEEPKKRRQSLVARTAVAMGLHDRLKRRRRQRSRRRRRDRRSTALAPQQSLRRARRRAARSVRRAEDARSTTRASRGSARSSSRPSRPATSPSASCAR